MAQANTTELANDLSIMAVRLIRWLRAADPAPALSGPEASAMAVIVHSGGITPSRLAELEQVQRPTISLLVERMAKRGLVRREVNPDDRRSSTIIATQEGLALWQAGQLRRVAPLAERIAGLSDADLRRLEEAMPLLSRLTMPPPLEP